MGKIRSCVRFKEVYSPKLGKKVRRCADYEGDLEDSFSELEDLGITEIASRVLSPDVLKSALIPLGVGAGTHIVSNMVIPKIPGIDKIPSIALNAARIIAGILLGGIATEKISEEVGLGILIGLAYEPVMNLVGSVAEQVGIAGYNQALLVKEESALPPPMEYGQNVTTEDEEEAMGFGEEEEEDEEFVWEE